MVYQYKIEKSLNFFILFMNRRIRIQKNKVTFILDYPFHVSAVLYQLGRTTFPFSELYLGKHIK